MDVQQPHRLALQVVGGRLCQARPGPDGALYIVDMYRFLIEHPRWIPADRLSSLAQQQLLPLLASLLRHPDARLRVYEDTGHCPNWERSEDVAADLDAFLLAG